MKKKEKRKKRRERKEKQSENGERQIGIELARRQLTRSYLNEVSRKFDFRRNDQRVRNSGFMVLNLFLFGFFCISLSGFVFHYS